MLVCSVQLLHQQCSLFLASPHNSPDDCCVSWLIDDILPEYSTPIELDSLVPTITDTISVSVLFISHLVCSLGFPNWTSEEIIRWRTAAEVRHVFNVWWFSYAWGKFWYHTQTVRRWRFQLVCNKFIFWSRYLLNENKVDSLLLITNLAITLLTCCSGPVGYSIHSSGLLDNSSSGIPLIPLRLGALFGFAEYFLKILRNDGFGYPEVLRGSHLMPAFVSLKSSRDFLVLLYSIHSHC